MYNKKICERAENIDKILNEYDVWADVYPHHTLPVVCVEINKGDWKHNHWRCDEILEEYGYVKMSEKTTWDDGSDCYSSIHYFA